VEEPTTFLHSLFDNTPLRLPLNLHPLSSAMDVYQQVEPWIKYKTHKVEITW